MAIDTQAPISRRGLLATAVAGTAAAIAGTVSRAERVFAAGSDGETVVVGGNYPDVRTVTTFNRTVNSRRIMTFSSDKGAVAQINNDGFAVVNDTLQMELGASELRLSAFPIGGGGSSASTQVGIASIALTTQNSGFQQTLLSSRGLELSGPVVAKPTGSGKVGVSGSGTVGLSGIGKGKSGKGVKGSGPRGGYFSGTKAQVRMQPSGRTTHPARGNRGDFFVDKKGRLWFCKGNRNWKQLA